LVQVEVQVGDFLDDRWRRFCYLFLRTKVQNAKIPSPCSSSRSLLMLSFSEQWQKQRSLYNKMSDSSSSSSSEEEDFESFFTEDRFLVGLRIVG